MSDREREKEITESVMLRKIQVSLLSPRERESVRGIE